MKKLAALLISALFIFTACEADSVQSEDGYDDVQELTYLYSSELPSLNYYIDGSATVYQAAAFVVDGLIEFDKYGIVKPAVAKEWEVSDDGLVWTFRLRDDVTWVDYTGEYVAHTTANDFVTAAEYCLNQDNASYYTSFYTSYFVGAEEYYDSTGPDYEGDEVDFADVGVKAIDDYTLEYTLLEPVPYFLTMMNWVPFYPVYAPFLEEVGEDFGVANDTFLYNGAMRMESWQRNSQRVLVKNESYYLADEIFLTKRTSQYNAEAVTLAPELFRRGEINYADISTIILDEWLADANLSQYIHPDIPGWYTYFYAFNFNPQFPDEYEPENWKIAVNNRNFRKAVFHAFDRMAAITTVFPHAPENNLIYTVTPPNYAAAGGLDFTQTGALADIVNDLPRYDTELAKEYRDAAKAELEEAGATFPIKMLMPYNSSSASWGQRVQVVKQNLERVLGSDFVELVIYDAPPTNFLADNRRNGRFAFLECNWGPDYADPETYTDPFAETGTYNKPQMSTEYINDDGVFEYYVLLEAAKAEKIDMAKRFELFAKAEAFLLEEAFVIPFYQSGGSWIASYLNPFDANFSTGSSISTFKLNNVRKLSRPLNAEQYNLLYDEWLAEREEALKSVQ